MSSAADAGLRPYEVRVGLNAEGRWPLPWLAAAFGHGQALRQAHGVLLVGPAGCGQFELATVLAQAELCEQPGRNGEPCGRCGSCHLVQARSHPDLLLVVPDAVRVAWGWLGEDDGKLAKADARPSKEVKVAQVREAIAWAQQTSARGRGKVLVIHPADALNAVAANALLKTLEEPPGRLRLLLTCTDAQRLLPTVRSRCQRLAMALPDAAAAAAWLRDEGLAEPGPLLNLASGSPLQARAYAAEGLDATRLGQLPQRVARGDASLLVGRAIPRVVDLLTKLAHDALAVTLGGAGRFFPAGSVPAGADAARLAAWWRALLRVARHEEHPWNAGLLVDALVAEAAAAWPAKVPPPSDRQRPHYTGRHE